MRISGIQRRTGIAMFFGAWVGFSISLGLAAMGTLLHFMGVDLQIDFTREMVEAISYRVAGLMLTGAVIFGSIGALTYSYVGKIWAWRVLGILLAAAGFIVVAMFYSILHPGIGPFLYAVVALVFVTCCSLGYTFFSQASRFAGHPPLGRP